MFNAWFSLSVFVAFISVATLVQGECRNYRLRLVPTAIYNDLKCTPKYAADQDDCIEEYDCSHIYNRPENTCHFKGKSYKIGEQLDNAELGGVWARDCTCSESLDITCPRYTDGCAESWVGGYPKPGCYLRRELDHYCASGEICPPFEGNAQCEVNGVTHKEGETFDHPDKKCVQCACGKGFDGKLEAPFCQPFNCTAELENSKAIRDSCAPFYKPDNKVRCCPDSWFCASENAVYLPNPLPTSLDNLNLHCKFGKKVMAVGEIATQVDSNLGEVTCECVLPPFPYCTVYSKQQIPMD